mmetsp:Transcript_35235/g.89187  ORF Transcript_35235/g.89187 Transcript_35235/m.89187 type:complete len:259 (-) Transcript_35235:278-1054(-)|eukprot:CAMPEP_0202869312 /NCGR_PEP_ID=MMETSP1391-20130828/12388_1 /ASSEMBLY_ACC=CAM_ASM_000867 /TAXON_ID=1034604 /ORGANISM="Chlamydomonas leiostraca, Strain SAG 11-49" /LENGTH=258 /DNA_ID=CAMNT_0049549621 /DNA_START=77 /DNA_END=853 /DNA_ORIENTATION=-
MLGLVRGIYGLGNAAWGNRSLFQASVPALTTFGADVLGFASKASNDKSDGSVEKKMRKPTPRPLSAFNLFVKARMSESRLQNPDKSMGQHFKSLASTFRSLSQSELKPYLQKADEERRKYGEKKARILPSRAPNARNLHMKDEFKTVKASLPAGTSKADLLKAIHSRYHALPESEKQRYARESQKLRQELHAKKEARKRKPTGYALFIKQHFARAQQELGADQPATAVVSHLAKKWQAMSQQEKLNYRPAPDSGASFS